MYYTMRVLIFGHGGWIGSMMCDLLQKENIDFVKSTVRANNVEQVEEEIKKIIPTHVMSFIGRTHGTYNDKYFSTIDYLEQEGKLVENIQDNLFSPLALLFLCNKYDIHYMYLGTGCIFKYDETHETGNELTGFLESDKPNFFGSSYSIVKGFTDQLMQMSNGLNLRIRMPITDKMEPRNFITKISSYEKICSIPNSMSVLDDLLPIALDMCIKKQTGTFNFTNPGVVTHDEVLSMYRDTIQPWFTWKNFTQEEQRKILAADRSNNCLDTIKLEKLYPQLKPIKESIQDVFQRMKIHTE